MGKIFLVILATLLSGCQSLPLQAATPTPSPCCHEEAPKAGATESMSLYNLESRWRDQTGRSLKLGELKGRVVCLAMMYASCKNACPRIIADMQALEAEVNKSYPGKVRFVLVSMDPKVDTPARLAKLAKTSRLGPNWTLLQGDSADVLELAAVLGVKYRKISATDYAHSNLVSVLDQAGVVKHRQEGLGVKPADSAAAVAKLLAPAR